MTLPQLQAFRKELLADKNKRGAAKRKDMLRAVDVWIRKRLKGKRK